MGNLFRRLWRLLNLSFARRFEYIEERFGRPAATLALMLFGAQIGIVAVWTSYGAILLWFWLQTRKQDPMLVLMLLIGWFLLGAVQGAWLGSALGYALARRLRQQTRAACGVCMANGLCFLLLDCALIGRFIPTERLFFVSLVSGLPTLAAVFMLVGSILLLFRD